MGLGVAGPGPGPLPWSPHRPWQLATTALYFTYSALEEEIDRNKDHPAFAPLYFPTELHRKKALIRDMEYLYGEHWEEQAQCSEATRKYVERIHEVGQNEPELLVAHAYTRYLGDPSRVPRPQKDRSEGPRPAQLRRAWPSSLSPISPAPPSSSS